MARRPCRYKAIEIASGCLCVYVCVCMSATFVARLVAIKDEDGDTCLVVFGWNARKRCLPLWHRFFSILVTRSSTLIHEFVGWKYDLVSRLVSVKRITGIFVAMFCWFASMSWRPCGRSFVREWFFTSFPTCIYVFSGIIMNTIEDNCYVIFSLSLFLRFHSWCCNDMKIGMVGEGTFEGMRGEGRRR